MRLLHWASCPIIKVLHDLGRYEFERRHRPRRCHRALNAALEEALGWAAALTVSRPEAELAGGAAKKEEGAALRYEAVEQRRNRAHASG